MKSASQISAFFSLSIMFAGFVAAVHAPAADIETGNGPLVGKPAPEFHVQGIYHESYSMEKFKGHILVMQFGASW